MDGIIEEVIVAPSARRGIPLKTLYVGRASSLDFLVVGVPPGVSRLKFHVSRPDTAIFSASPAAQHKDGKWHVYASGLYFPDVGTARYHLTGTDCMGNSTWLGSGTVRVLQSVLNDTGSADLAFPEDTYVRNPSTGLWHKLTMTIEDGELVPIIAREGVSR